MAHDLIIRDLAVRHFGPLSLTVRAGECLGISGPSGCGKSSLLRAVADLEAHEGQLFLGDLSSDAIPGPEWRRRVMLLPSESAWWHDVVADHFLEPESVNPEVLGLTHAHMVMPVKRLSSGERQRLGLLRLLERKPKVLLLDEPTANLDAGCTELAESLILDYARDTGAPVVWVAHDTEQLSRVSVRRMAMDSAGVFDSVEVAS